jgi:fumarylacetoacetate (FAA) hydrolase
VDFGAALAIVTGDIPMDCAPDRALDGVRLLMLCNGVQLHAGALGTLQPGAAFSPVAVTPDELGEAWSRGRLQGQLQVSWNGRKVGMCDAGANMHFHFGRLISALAQAGPVPAGSIVGSGPVRNKAVERKGRAEWPQGYCSIAEKRAMETVQDGQPGTDFMQAGDTVRIEFKDPDGASIFGAIEQEVVDNSAYKVSPASAVAQIP